MVWVVPGFQQSSARRYAHLGQPRAFVSMNPGRSSHGTTVACWHAAGGLSRLTVPTRPRRGGEWLVRPRVAKV